MERRLLLAAAAATGVAAVAGCATVGLPRTVVITEAQLQQRLAAMAPTQRRLLAVLDVQLDPPQVRLLPERGRIGATMNLAVSERISLRQARGRIEADSALRFEPSDVSLRLAQVHVSAFELDGGPWPGPLRHAAAVLAEQVLEDQPVWRASPAQAERLRRAGVQTVDVQVTGRGIEIALGAAAEGY